jgi:hypothetical protein
MRTWLILAENLGGIGMCLWCYWKDLDGLKIQINSKKPGFGRTW